jgi:hypothetical protein
LHVELPLDIGDDLPGIGLVPAAVQLLGGQAELNGEVARKVLWRDLSSFLAPKPQQSRFVTAHNDPGIRATDEVAAILRGFCPHTGVHDFYQSSH